MSANEKQVGGNHYRKQKIQHWDYVLANDIPYLEAQVIKYVSRWRDKNGVEDLEKARHFLDKLIESNTLPIADLCAAAAAQTKSEPVQDCLIYEGGTATEDLYECRVCREHFSVAVGYRPVMHKCSTAEPRAKGYVDQD